MKTICFLCKQNNDLTEEHVFPKWLQQKYSLWNQHIRLLNGSRIQYKTVKIPSCKECNSRYLSTIENKVAQIIKQGSIIDSIAERDTIFIWLYKLMFGLHYKELFLKADIRDINSSKIASMDTAFGKGARGLMLLYARNIVSFVNFKPYSLFLFELTDSTDNNYFYADEPLKMYSAAIFGKIGVVCSYQCDGFIENDIRERMGITDGMPLTLPEFGTFAAFVLHLKTRMKMLPNYKVITDESGYKISIQDADTVASYDQFDPKLCTEITRNMFAFCFDKLIENDKNGVPTMRYRSPFVFF